MIVITYICDKCGKETSYTDLYSIEITRGAKSAGGNGGSCYSPIMYNTKHICTKCLEGMFPIAINTTQ